MRDAENVQKVALLKPDLLGFIFYKKSPRYVGDNFDKGLLKQIPASIKRVGVFVNESEQAILNYVKQFSLDYVQLHGHEDPALVKSLAQQVKVIKAFGIDENFDAMETEGYSGENIIFLFDTKNKNFGGSGKAFDRKLLEKYKGSTGYLISGGIGPENYSEIMSFDDPRCMGVDLNSRFEIAPGVKNVELLKTSIYGTTG